MPLESALVTEAAGHLVAGEVKVLVEEEGGEDFSSLSYQNQPKISD